MIEFIRQLADGDYDDAEKIMVLAQEKLKEYEAIKGFILDFRHEDNGVSINLTSSGISNYEIMGVLHNQIEVRNLMVSHETGLFKKLANNE